VVLIVGGGLTALLTTNNDSSSYLPVLRQVGSPEGSTLEVVGWKAEQLFLLVGFIIFNLVGIGATLAILMWLLHRFVKQANATENQGTTVTAVEKAGDRKEALQKT
jgi:hypothetical protein